jgi:hypothetical protein
MSIAAQEEVADGGLGWVQPTSGNDAFMEIRKDDAPRDQLALQLFRLLDQTGDLLASRRTP